MKDIELLLGELETPRAGLDLVRSEKETLRAQVMKAVQGQLLEIDAEFDPKLEDLQERLAAVEGILRAKVKQSGQSVKGETLQVIFVRGRESWDEKALKGYAAAHPEIYQFQKIGEPSVQIRSVK